ncbi:MAG: LOG family protein [Acidobacteria bacterium]|nr:LOG family protein [Acidobacteriota bacterium]
MASAFIISVFGSSRCAQEDETYTIALNLGAALARADFAVASGGYGGTMEAVSRGATEAGGRVIGVVASVFSTKANPWVQETIVVSNWEDRLLQLIALGDGYVALPGGTGTLVELAVAWEMIHKHIMPSKPLLAFGEFWRPIISQVESADGNSRGLVGLANDVPDAVAALRAALHSASPPHAP